MLMDALYDFSYAEIAEMCGCTKSAVGKSINAVKNIFGDGLCSKA